MAETMVSITEERYIELQKAELKLIALENGGVDNWSWYGDSIRNLAEEFYNNGNYEDLELLGYSKEDFE